MTASRESDAGDLDARMVDMTDEAAECRLLRHAWPRKKDRDYAIRTKIVVVARNRKGQPTQIERVMSCTGDCGTTKTLLLAVDPKTGRSERINSSMNYSPGYLLKPKDAYGHRYPAGVDQHEIQYTLLQRLYPDLQW